MFSNTAVAANRRSISTTKPVLLALLIGLNLVLVLALLSVNNSLPAAWAQGGGRAGEYLCVTAKPAGQAYDVLYVLDQAAHKLHAFYPGQPPSKQMLKAEPRDVRKDFGS